MATDTQYLHPTIRVQLIDGTDKVLTRDMQNNVIILEQSIESGIVDAEVGKAIEYDWDEQQKKYIKIGEYIPNAHPPPDDIVVEMEDGVHKYKGYTKIDGKMTLSDKWHHVTPRMVYNGVTRTGEYKKNPITHRWVTPLWAEE